jgi:hypothetical protein
MIKKGRRNIPPFLPICPQSISPNIISPNLLPRAMARLAASPNPNPSNWAPTASRFGGEYEKEKKTTKREHGQLGTSQSDDDDDVMMFGGGGGGGEG